MKTLRTTVTCALVLLMGGGHLASLYAYFLGDPAAYVRALDESPVPSLAFLLLIAVVALAFVPERAEGQE